MMKDFKKLDGIEWITIICLVLAPIVIAMLLPIINFSNGSDDGWLGFWGGYLGAIIAIVGVWWQTNKTIKNEKESMFSNARPFFNLTVERDTLNFGKLYVTSDEEIELGRKVIYLKIDNFSNKLMMKVVLKIYTKDGRTDKISIGRIEGGESIQIAPSWTHDIYKMSITDSEFNELDLKIKKICVYFTTEKGERLKLYFKNINGNIENIDSEKIVESNATKNNLNKLNEEYSNNEVFKESKMRLLKK